MPLAYNICCQENLNAVDKSQCLMSWWAMAWCGGTKKRSGWHLVTILTTSWRENQRASSSSSLSTCGMEGRVTGVWLSCQLNNLAKYKFGWWFSTVLQCGYVNDTCWLWTSVNLRYNSQWPNVLFLDKNIEVSQTVAFASLWSVIN